MNNITTVYLTQQEFDVLSNRVYDTLIDNCIKSYSGSKRLDYFTFKDHSCIAVHDNYLLIFSADSYSHSHIAVRIKETQPKLAWNGFTQKQRAVITKIHVCGELSVFGLYYLENEIARTLVEMGVLTIKDTRYTIAPNYIEIAKDNCNV